MSAVMNHHTSAPVDVILSRLENVKATGSGWRADCPVGHKSKGVLSIRTSEDGRALLHCFAECSALEILHTLGLELRDLYPDEPARYVPPAQFKKLSREERAELAKARRIRRIAAQRCEWAAALGVLQFEATVLLVASAQLTDGVPLTDADHFRLQEAMGRIESAGQVLK